MSQVRFLFAAFFVFLGVAASAEGLTEGDRQQFSQEVQYIGSILNTVYAPKMWKEKHLGWDLPSEIIKAQLGVSQARNLHEARSAVAGLIKSTADYHVSYSFYTTERATLPFQVKTFQGQTLIVYIDRSKLSKIAFPFEVGDEVLTMNQSPVSHELEMLMQNWGANVPATDLAMADLYLTRRTAKSNHVVPQGPVIFGIKNAKGQARTVQLVWEYEKEELLPIFYSPLKKPAKSLKIESMFVMGDQAWKEFASDEVDSSPEMNRYGLGVRESFIPDFGSRIWQTAADNTFDAYMFMNNEGKLIGVVRIPSYVTRDYEKAMKDFSAIIQHLDKHTAALIIDQTHNPGGSVFYLYALASTLSDQTLKVPLHRIALSQSEAKDCLDTISQLKNVKNDEEAAATLKSMGGFPMTYQLVVGIRAHCQQLVAEFQRGEKLSSPLYLWGVEEINPAPHPYTKPVVMLIDELDFSGGDFMPATLQDNKKVTLVGTRTAGAGGFVLSFSFPNSIGLESFSLTGSIAERVDKNPIENLGVTPDVELTMQAEDVKLGFPQYRSRVLQVVKDVLNP